MLCAFWGQGRPANPSGSTTRHGSHAATVTRARRSRAALPRRALLLILTVGLVSAADAQFQPGSFSSANRVRVETHLSVDGVHPGGTFHAAVQLDIEDGWHINSHTPLDDSLIPTTVTLSEHPDFDVVATRYPTGTLYRFSFSDEPLDVHEGTVFVYVEVQTSDTVQLGEHVLTGTLRVQACDDSVCLAPSDVPVTLTVPVVDPSVPVAALDADIFSPARMYTVGSAAPRSGSGSGLDVAALFDQGSWALAFVALFLLGLALNLTPCVYPMITVTVSLFGSQTDTRTARVFAKAVVFVLGICTMYSALGLAAALSGGLFGGVLQSQWVLVGIGVLFVLLAMSMFGLYEIQLPLWLTRRLGGTQVAGTLGIYVSGLIVGVFAAPCIGPPIIALLAFVGQKADPVFGFASFFIMSLGLGAPYVVLGTFSGLLKRLPRSGAWMAWVKKVFGVILVGVAAFYLSLAFNPDLIYYLIPLTLVAGGIYLGFLERSDTGRPAFTWIKRSVGAAALVAGVVFYLAGQTPSLEWQPHSTEEMAAARNTGRPVVLYFAADWCIPCLELDRLTFTDQQVIAAMDGFMRLKVDLTNYDSPESALLRERFDIAGVPTIVFLDGRGQELAGTRVVGYVPAAEMLERATALQRHQDARAAFTTD
jgi:thioredoxin:protein disulfide reductase